MAHEEPPVSIGNVGLRLTEFWTKDATAWFATVEAQFQTRKITSSRTRYHHVVASLNQETCSIIRDILVGDEAEQTYENLKATLIKRTSLSEEQRMRKLVALGPLGDRRPSQLFRDMQLLDPGDDAGSGMKKSIFINLMPAHIRAVLRASKDLSLAEISDLADRVLDPQDSTASGFFPISQVSPQAPPSPSDVQVLRRPAAQQSTNFCWYHSRWGSKAKKCNPPCSWSSENAPPRR